MPSIQSIERIPYFTDLSDSFVNLIDWAAYIYSGFLIEAATFVGLDPARLDSDLMLWGGAAVLFLLLVFLRRILKLVLLCALAAAAFEAARRFGLIGAMNGAFY